MELNFQNSSLNNTYDNKSIEDLIELTLLNNFEFDIAVLFYKMCKNEYKTTLQKSKSDATLSTWYIFKNEKWEKETKKNILEKIKSVLNNLYENKINLLVTELNTITSDNVNYKSIKNKKMIAEKILNKLKKEYFIKNIMKESVELFYSE
jgi:ribosomal protein S25